MFVFCVGPGTAEWSVGCKEAGKEGVGLGPYLKADFGRELGEEVEFNGCVCWRHFVSCLFVYLRWFEGDEECDGMG